MTDTLKILNKIEKGKLSVEEAIQLMEAKEVQPKQVFKRKNYFIFIFVKKGWFPLFLILPTFIEGLVYPILKQVAKESPMNYQTLKSYVKNFRYYGPGTLCHVNVQTPDFNHSGINVHATLI